ncbi:hypothetical protein DEO72_LG8g923 [Vigna unguiculata]|uniref:Uncharacterized protein n=1 Tax=Vigna unguiculata TaxID=3917 RepID=A0A4D6MSK7_VIGUN|nr:hypothetical protein DEO72_LG8g923 [Vigna unguiculata]
MDGVTCDDMSGEVHIKLLSRGDTSGEVRMFRAHVERCHVRGGADVDTGGAEDAQMAE